jgi:hypothetical protein
MGFAQVTPLQSQLATDNLDCMQQPVKQCSFGVCQQNSLWLLYLSSYHDDILTNKQHNKFQSVQPLNSGVAVIHLHQEAGNHTYMHSNEAELSDTCAAVARCSHACLCTAYYAH